MPCSLRPTPLRLVARRLALLSVALLGLLVGAAPALAQLVVTVEANPGIAVPGEQLEVRVTVANQGVADVGGVVLNLLIPAELDGFLTSVATPGATGCTQIFNNTACTTGETLIWSFGTLTAGQSVTASLTPIVSATAVGPIVFNPVLNSGPSASTSVAIDPGLSLDVSLNEARDPVATGGSLAYTLHFGNRSAVDSAPNALLRLPLPSGTSFVAASDGGVLNGSAVEWSLGTLQPGQSGTRSVTLAVGAGLPRGGSLVGIATLSDSSPQQAEARAVTEVDAAEALSLALTVGPDPAAPGEQLDLQLTVSNTSASAVPTVIVLLRWPQEIVGLFTAQGTGSPAGCTQVANNAACSAGELSVWSLGTLAAGQSMTVTYSAEISAVPDGTIVDFRATAQSVNLDERAESSRSVAVDATSPLDVSIHEERDPVAPGGALAYTIAFGNRSTTSTAPNALLRLPLPVGSTFVSASGGGVLNGGAIEWSLGTLQPGQSGKRSVLLTPGAGLAAGTLLQAEVALSDASSPAQLARASAVTEIDGLAGLALALVVGPDPAAPGEQLDLELTVSNTSAASIPTVTLHLRWPEEIADLLTGQGTGSPNACTQILNNAACSAGEFAQWSLGTLTPGQSVTLTYSAALAAVADGSVVEFEALAQSAATVGQVRAGRAVIVDATSPLDLSIQESLDPIASGDDLAYTIAFGNRSPTVATPNTLLRLPLPAGTTFVAASGGGVVNAGAVEWSLGTLQPGQAGTRSVTLEIAPGLAAGTLLAVEVALSDTSSPQELARAGAVTSIDAGTGLELAIVVAPDPIAPGEQLDLELTVSNTSASAIPSVTLLLRWPFETAANFTGQGTSSPGGCTQILNNAGCSAGEFTQWTLGNLAAGQSVTVTYSAALTAAPDGSVVEFEALAQGLGIVDQVRTGRAVLVDLDRPLELGLHEPTDPITAGDSLAYTISFVNRSRATTAPNALLRFPLPIGTTLVSASDGGAFNDGAVEWPLGSLPPGRSGTRGVVLATDAGLGSGSLIQADAFLADASPSIQRARAGGVTEIDGLEALETSIDVVLDHVDWAYQIDVTVTNTDAVSHSGVTLTLRIPRDTVPFIISTVTGAPTFGCTQIANNTACTGGEFLLWSPGTLAAGQSVTVRIPNLYIAVPTTESAELFALTAIALGSGTNDRAVDHVVPEPGSVASLVAGIGLLGLLSRIRRTEKSVG
ncbi:MAG: hypothetical protein U0900_15650 [Myxococcota bacterium]